MFLKIKTPEGGVCMLADVVALKRQIQHLEETQEIIQQDLEECTVNLEDEQTKLNICTDQVFTLVPDTQNCLNKIIDLQQDFEECNIELDFCEQELQRTIEGSQFSDTFFDGSTLLDANTEFTLIEFLGTEWLGDVTLLYKATKYGFAASTFHARCDNQGPTVTIIKRTGFHGIYGGYTNIPWTSVPPGYADDGLQRSFLWTMSNNEGEPEKYEQHSTPYAVYHNSAYGPTFGGGHDLRVVDNAEISTGSYTSLGYTYGSQLAGESTDYKWTSLNGKHNDYTIDEIEVFALVHGDK